MSLKKSILIVVESIDVNDSSASKGRVALIQNLYRAGFELKVCHYTRKSIALDGIECIAIKEQRLTLSYGLSKFQVFIKRLTNQNFNPTIEKWFGFSFAFFNDSYSIRKALQKENPNDYDWILTLSKASSFRPHKALLELPQWHSKWLAYIHDPYPIHSYPRPYDWVEPGHQKKREFFLEIAEKCRYAVYPSKLLGEWMEGYYKHLKGKSLIIPHQITKTHNNSTVLPSYFKEMEFTILHAGTLLWGRDPNGLVKGLQKFLKLNPEAEKETKLIFLGGKNHYSSELKFYAERISQLYISDDYVPFDQVYQMQLKSVVNVILEAKGSISPFLPGKFPHCVKANKPILLIGPYYSESRRLLGDDYLYWAEIDETDKIAGLLEVLYHQWKKDSTQLILNRPDLEEYLSVKHLTKTINKIVEKI